jgi:hypothetical protein
LRGKLDIYGRSWTVADEYNALIYLKLCSCRYVHFGPKCMKACGRKRPRVADLEVEPRQDRIECQIRLERQPDAAEALGFSECGQWGHVYGDLDTPW